jgi:hypothetical protein
MICCISVMALLRKLFRVLFQAMWYHTEILPEKCIACMGTMGIDVPLHNIHHPRTILCKLANTCHQLATPMPPWTMGPFMGCMTGGLF